MSFSSGCGRNVVERAPELTAFAKDDTASGYVTELRNQDPLLLSRRSPDGRKELRLVQDTVLFLGTGFCGVEIRDQDDDRVVPVLSLWEVDSGPSLSWAWSSDSGAIRFYGTTTGFERGGWFSGRHDTRVDFDYVYIIVEDRFVAVSE